MFKNATQAAKHVKRSKRSVERWVAKGDLPKPPWTAAQLDAVLAAKRAASCVKTAQDVSPPAPITEEMGQAIRRLYAAKPVGPGLTVTEICTKLGITNKQFQDYRKENPFVHASEPFTAHELHTDTVEGLVEDGVELAKQAIARGIEKGVARDARIAASKWHNFETEARKFADALVQEMGIQEAPHKKAAPDPPLGVGKMLMIHPTDLHYGKRGWDGLGPGAYDRKIARQRLFACIDKILDRAGPVERILLYTGSDASHVDSNQGATTKGTSMITGLDGTPVEIATGMAKLSFEIADYLRPHCATLKIKVCPGNHDAYTSSVIHACMQMAYAGCDDVIVDGSFAKYQVEVWGVTAILSTHGDGRHTTADLQQVFTTQFAREWADAKVRIAVRGNLHHSKEEEACGLRNILLPSLSGNDEYHANNWPVGGRVAMRAPLFMHHEGPIGTIEAAV